MVQENTLIKEQPMSDEEQTIRDWHRLFGTLLTDFFTDSPFSSRLPDGMD
jgi:hypothetical protein